MRAIIQRVSSASVAVDGKITGKIEQGLLVLLGVGEGDQESDLDYIYNKTLGLRVFEDTEGKMNRSVIDIGGGLLVVSQFTLFGDVRRGKRPSFTTAAAPQLAKEFYERFLFRARADEIDVQSGIFQAEMMVSLVNEGPVTIMLDSRKTF